MEHPRLLPALAGITTRAPRLALVLSLTAVLAVALLVTLPFAGQAFHMDDDTYWSFAKVNLESPFQHHLTDFHLMGEDFGQWRDTHPLLAPLYLSLVMLVTGSNAELPLHLGFIFFPALAGISMFFLARRFIRNALAAALLLLVTPAFIVMSHTLMGDIPMVAFWLAATALYIHGVDRDSTLLLALSGVAAILAVFSGYPALALVVLLPLYAWMFGRLTRKTALPMLLPVVAFALFILYNLAVYGEPPRFAHAGGLSIKASHLYDRIEGTFLHVGGASVFPLLLAALFSLRRRRYLLLPWVTALAAALGSYHYHNGYPLASAVLFTVFLTASAMVVTAVISEVVIQLRRALRQESVDVDYIYLGLWLILTAGMNIILLPHATAKYCLIFFAPLILLLFREIEARLGSGLTLKALVAAAIILTFMTGALVSSTDFHWAQGYKDYATSLKQRHRTTGTVWFVGEWGFRHYMESEGYRYLSSSNESPVAGDLVVKAGLMDWPLADSVTYRMKLVESSNMDWDFPVRTMNFDADAGFYGTHWGQLPYSISSEPLDEFQVYRIEG